MGRELRVVSLNRSQSVTTRELKHRTGALTCADLLQLNAVRIVYGEVDEGREEGVEKFFLGREGVGGGGVVRRLGYGEGQLEEVGSQISSPPIAPNLFVDGEVQQTRREREQHRQRRSLLQQ
jgi:hypothetical protein